MKGIPGTDGQWGVLEDYRMDVGIFINGRSLTALPHAREAFIAYDSDGFNDEYDAFLNSASNTIDAFRKTSKSVERVPRRGKLRGRREMLDMILEDDNIPLEVKWVQVQEFSKWLTADLLTNDIIELDPVKQVYAATRRERDKRDKDYPGINMDHTVQMINEGIRARNLMSKAMKPALPVQDDPDAENMRERDLACYRQFRSILVRGAGMVISGVSSLAALEMIRYGVNPLVAGALTVAVPAGVTLAARRYEQMFFDKQQVAPYAYLPRLDDVQGLEAQVRGEYTAERIITGLINKAGIGIDSGDGAELELVTKALRSYLGFANSELTPMKALEDMVQSDDENNSRDWYNLQKIRQTYTEIRTNPFQVMRKRLEQLNDLKDKVHGSKAPSLVRVFDDVTLTDRVNSVNHAINDETAVRVINTPNVRYELVKLLESLNEGEYNAVCADYRNKVEAVLKKHSVDTTGYFTLPDYLNIIVMRAPYILAALRQYETKQTATNWGMVEDLLTFANDDDSEARDLLTLAYGMVDLGKAGEKVPAASLFTPADETEYRILKMGIYDKTAGKIHPVVVDLQAIGNILSLKREGKHFWRSVEGLLVRLGRTQDADFIKSLPENPKAETVNAVLQRAMIAQPSRLHDKLVNRILTLTMEDVTGPVVQTAIA